MPGLNPTQQDLDQFCEITGAQQSDAERFLQPGVALETAIEDYFAAQSASLPASHELEADEDFNESSNLLDDDDYDPLDDMSDPQEETPAEQPASQGQRVGGTTLSGQPAEALPAGWGRPAASRFGRIEDLHREPARPPPGEDSDEEDERKGETTYAGGERSGLAIEQPGQRAAGGGPGDMVKDILKQASTNGEQRRAEETKRAGERSWGAGNTLGSDEVPSASIPAARVRGARPPGAGALPPQVAAQGGMGGLLAGLMGGQGAPAPGADDEDDGEEEEAQTRRLTFWRNGFSIEDGPLLDYDTPENKALLQAIQNGRAPPSVFGVRYNQPITIEVAERRREDYQPPPKQPMKAFSGGGNRLGSPAPEATGSGSRTPTMPGGFGAAGGVAVPERSGTPLGTPGSAGRNPAAGGGQSGFSVDESKPTTSIQVRLGDGTRIVAKVNLTHRVGDLRNFVSAARADSRPFVLQTTFPSKTLDDPNQTIEEAGLKNAVVVQRFT